MRTNFPRILIVVVGLATYGIFDSQAQEESVSTVDSVRKYRFLGKTARDKGEIQAIIDYYSELLKYQEPDRRTLFYIGRAYLRLGDQEGAKGAFLHAAAIDSSHANTALSLFQIFSAETKPDSAWLFLERLLKAKPSDPRLLGYRRNIADLHRRQSHPRAALVHYEELVDNKAVPAGVRTELAELIAVLYSDLGDAQSALAWRRRTLGQEGEGNQIETLRKMVDLQLETQDFKAAFATLRQLTQIDSAGRYSHFLRMAEIGERRRNDGMKLAGLEGMASVQPDDLETVATLAEYHIQGERSEAAMHWIDRGLGRQPEHAHLLILRGDLLYEAGSEDDAVASFESAMADPNWAAVAQQRIWQIRPPETEEEKLKRQFFGGGTPDSETSEVSGG